MQGSRQMQRCVCVCDRPMAYPTLLLLVGPLADVWILACVVCRVSCRVSCVCWQEALRQVPGMARSTTVRPGGIIGRQGRSLGYDWLNDLLGPFLSRLGMAVHIDDIAKSMLQVTMQPTSDTTIPEVLENEDIKAAARVYEAGLVGASSGGGGSGHDEAEKNEL